MGGCVSREAPTKPLSYPVYRPASPPPVRRSAPTTEQINMLAREVNHIVLYNPKNRVLAEGVLSDFKKERISYDAALVRFGQIR